jgi:hypothetical protein
VSEGEGDGMGDWAYYVTDNPGSIGIGIGIEINLPLQPNPITPHRTETPTHMRSMNLDEIEPSLFSSIDSHSESFLELVDLCQGHLLGNGV